MLPQGMLYQMWHELVAGRVATLIEHDFGLIWSNNWSFHEQIMIH